MLSKATSSLSLGTIKKKHTTLDADKWDAYTTVDYTVAIILVVVSMISAEVPRSRASLARQQSAQPPAPAALAPGAPIAAPYVARGWRPSGPQFNLPARLVAAQQPQQVYQRPQTQPQPQLRPTYGPPPAEEPEVTTTEQSTTTEASTEESAPQVDNLELDPRRTKPKPQSAKLEQPARGQFYVLLPQNQQNIVYAAPQRSAALIAAPAALPNIQAYRAANLVAAPIQAIPLTSAITQSVFTPYSASYFQIYQ